MKRLTPIIILLLLTITTVVPVSAQETGGQIVDTTTPISAELRASINAWLAVSAPAAVPFWAVTYVQPEGSYTYVSLVGLDLTDPEAAWSLEDGQAVWAGTVKVFADGSVELRSQPPQASAEGLKLAAPILPAAGGGSYVNFPWQSGKKMMFGSRGVHGSGDYGTSGMLAVDLVGGDNLGSGVAGPNIYASDGGTVDYVCDDGTSVAIRTHNTTTGDYFIYAHLMDNTNLAMDHVFLKNSAIGVLRYGSFNDTCGWAEQQASNYHLHWMFTPAGGSFRAENCILSISDKKWACGATTVNIGGYIFGGGGSGTTGTGGDDPTINGDVTFFDFFLVGAVSIFDKALFKYLPSHNAFAFTQVLYNTIKLTLRVVRVLVYGNINLAPLMTILIAAVGIKLTFGTIWLVAFVLKAWKSLIPIVGA